MRDKLRRLGIAAAVIAAVAGTAVALPSAANARWGGGWHGGHGGWGWGGFGVGLGTGVLLGAATAPYYGGYYGYTGTHTDMARLTLPMVVAPIMAVAAPSGVAGSGTVTAIACGGACGSVID